MQKGGAGVGLAMATTKHSQMEKVKYKSKSQEHWIRIPQREKMEITQSSILTKNEMSPQMRTKRH